MPNNITDVVAWTTPVQTVADGDDGSAANFALAPQGLANRTAYLNSAKMNVSGGSFSGAVTGSAITMTASASTPSISAGAIALTGSTPVTLAARSVTRIAAGTMTPSDVASWDTLNNMTKVSGFAVGVFPIDPPHGSTITSISAFTLPASGHSGLPATMPIIALWTVNAPACSGAYGVSAVDPSASVSAYQLAHAISAATTVTVNKSIYRYYVAAYTEQGANALSGATWPGVAYAVTLTAMDQCAS